MSNKDRTVDWDVDEFHMACAKLDAAPDGVQVIDLETWHNQNENFERETRRMVQRIKESQKNG